jgi:hypothetical protein
LKCYTWSTALYGAENWTLRKVDQKYWKFRNVVLKKNGKDQLDLSCEEWGSVTYSQGKEVNPAWQ